MQITCPSCKKQRSIDEKLIPPSVTMARCKKCGQRFPIKKGAGQAGQPAVEGAAKKGARKIGVSISKGGVGKTTTSVNLAHGLAMAGFKVLLIDTDTQGQDSFMLGIKAQAGLTELVTEELSAEETIVKARENLWLLAGGKSLAGVKRLIDRKDFGGEKTMAESLAPLEANYDYIIVDTSPGWDPLTVNVLFFVTNS